jgi:hypothetical protein
VIDRSLVGKEYPPFSVSVTDDLSRDFRKIFNLSHLESSAPASNPPLIWPALMTGRGTACLIPVWEDLGVDPLKPKLMKEKFHYYDALVQGEQLVGRVCIEDINERVEPGKGIDEQVDLLVEFKNSRGSLVASYRCSFRIPVAIEQGRKSI